MNDNETILLLKQKSIFNDAKELGEYLQIQIKNPLLRLKYYCEYHKENKRIIIDKVFDFPKEHRAWRTLDFKYNVGDVIHTSTGEVTVLRQFRDKPNDKVGNIKCYECKCNKDGMIFVLKEHQIYGGTGCPICGGRKLIQNVNSLYDEHPELIKYLKYPEESKEVKSNDSRKLLCVCPECGYEKYVEVGNLVDYGFFCNICSERISYPNKFMINLLQQLKIEFNTEAIFKWSNRKAYDVYISSHSIIIENHGLQHYEDFRGFTHRTLLEEQENDRYKYEMAINNGIQNYIVLDCRKSKVDWIKQSVMSSDLPKILHFEESDIDWEECEKYALKNIVLEIWDDWNINFDIDKLVEKFKLRRRTISNYILHGVELGVCTKSLNDIYLETVNEVRKDAYSKPIHCITDDVYFKTKFEAGEYYKDIFPKTGALKLTTYINQNTPYKGKMFEYITKEEFNNMKELSLTDNGITVIGDKFNIK